MNKAPQKLFKTVTVFGLRFALIYGLLLLPWPGLKEASASYFRAVGNAVFAHRDSSIYVKFEALPPRETRAPETRIVVANLALRNAQGETPARHLDVDLRGVAWVPLVWLAALILASPVPGPRKAWAFFWGMLAIHGFILFSLGIYIVNQSDAASGLHLVELSSWAKELTDELENILITQMGASFVVPVMLWILVTFRREDVENLLEEIGTQP
jgi:hypothetical protein